MSEEKIYEKMRGQYYREGILTQVNQHLALTKAANHMLNEAKASLEKAVFFSSDNQWCVKPIETANGVVLFNAIWIGGENVTYEKQVDIVSQFKTNFCKFERATKNVTSVEIYILVQFFKSIGFDWFHFPELKDGKAFDQYSVVRDIGSQEKLL